MQPPPLRRCRFTASDGGTLAIQDNDVPRAEIVAVVGLAGLSRDGSKIPGVTRGATLAVLVITWRRPRTFFEATPGRSITFGELLVAPVRISQITYGKNCPGDVID